MKRFITYLYEYENGKKGKNCGFARLDIREKKVRLQLRLQGRLEKEAGTLFLVAVGNGEKPEGLELGTVDADREVRLWNLTAEKILGSRYDIKDVIGMGICFASGFYAASCWTQKPPVELTEGTFSRAKKEDKASEGEWTVRKNETNQTAKAEQPVIKMLRAQETQENSVSEEVNRKNGWEVIRGDESPQECYRLRKIDIGELAEISPKNRYMMNNSFLLHGFFNYKYLVILEREKGHEKDKELFVGVPGRFQQAERAMAFLFGFSTFVPQAQTIDADGGNREETEEDGEEATDQLEASEIGEVPVGSFGFWCARL